MDSLDTKNFSIINKLVGDYFSLSPTSFDLFSKALLEGREIPEEFASILKDSPDGRVRFKASTAINEKMDDGWRLWKEKYSSFYQNNKIKYEEYYDNRIKSEGSSDQKLSKFMAKWFFENPKSFLEQICRYNSFSVLETFLRANKIEKEKFFSDVFEKEDNVKAAVETCNTMKLSAKDGVLKVKFSIKKNDKNVSVYITIDKFAKVPYFESFINYYIIKANEEIGRVALPKSKGLELVFSVNFADWLLCSTAESWSSCLSLTASYSAGFWAGLPGTILDKNRALIYLTDGKKKNYKGIEVDRIITRSWLLLMNDNGKDKIHFVNEYPGGFSLFNLTKESLKDCPIEVSSYRELSSESSSKYPFRALYHKVGNRHLISSIFFDTTYLKPAPAKGELKYAFFKHMLGGRGGATFGYTEKLGKLFAEDFEDGGINLDARDDDEDECSGSGLDYVINKGLTILDFITF